MSDTTRGHGDASGSRPRTPVPSSSETRDTADIARLENDLIPSPPASEGGQPRQHGTSSSTGPSFSNIDGSARIYRFPNELPPRVEGPTLAPDPNERVVTVRDLRTKSCWICSDEDEDPLLTEAQGSSSRSASPTPSRRKRFVHPCNCTLVAHESCLLRWIDQSKRDHPLQDHVTCPQCKAPYILINSKTPLLKILDFFDRLVSRVEPFAFTALLGGSVLVACTTYGCVAIRLFLGKDAARRALASPWPWHYWFDIPLLPFVLIASRLNVFESAMTWIPTLVAFPITSLPMLSATAAHGRLMDTYVKSSIFNARAYPPGPALTALLVPWIRAFYLALKRRVYRAVLSPFYGGRRSTSTRTTDGRGNRRRVIIVGESDSYLVDGDAALGAEGTGDGTNGGTMELRWDPPQNAAENDEGRQVVYVSHRSFGRLCLGALYLPVIANLMGRLLARLARFSPLLARFLGIKSVSPASTSLFSSFYTTKATPTSTSKASQSPSPIAALFRGQLPVVDDASQEAKVTRAAAGAEESFANRLTLLGYSPRYDDLDPVWFRNAVGAGLYIVLKDASCLLYRYLRLSQRRKTSVKDLPFQAGLVAGLDLRD